MFAGALGGIAPALSPSEAPAATPVFRQQEVFSGAVGRTPANASVAGRDGSWIAAWDAVADSQGCGTDREIVVARTGDHGLNWDPPTPLFGADCALDQAASDTDPVVLHLGGTDWLLLWVSNYDPAVGVAHAAADTAILFSLSDDDGRTWSPAAPIDAGRVGDGSSDAAPAAAFSRGRRLVVAWESDVRGNTDIWYAALDVVRNPDPAALAASWPAAQLAGGPMVAIDHVNGGFSDRDPAVATDDAGTWMLVWSRDTQGANTSVDIALTVSTDNAREWAIGNFGFSVNSYEQSAAMDIKPSVATDSQGTWGVVWQSWHATDPVDGRALGPDPDILFASSDVEAGNPTWWMNWTQRGAIATHAPAATQVDESPVVAVGADGAWAIAWTTRGQATPADGDDDEVWIARAAPAGSWPPAGHLNWHGDTALNSLAWHDGMDDDRAPALAADRRGRWMAIWPRTFPAAVTVPGGIGFARGRELMAPIFAGAEILGEADADSRPATARGDAHCEASGGDLGWAALWDYAEFGDSAIVGSESGDNGRNWSPSATVADATAGHRRPDLAAGRCEWRAAWDTDLRFSWLIGPAPTDIGADRDLLWSHGTSIGSMLKPGWELQDHIAVDFNSEDGWAAVDSADDWLLRMASLPEDVRPRASRMCFTGPLNGRRCQQDAQCGGGQCLESEVRTLAVWEAREGDVCQGGLFDGRPCVTDIECGGGLCPVSTVLVSHKFEPFLAAHSWVNPRPIDTTTTARVTDVYPDTAGDGTGIWMAAWTRFDQPAGQIPESRIVLARSSDNAATWGAPLTLAVGGAPGLEDVLAPRIATDGSGTWMVVWSRAGRVDRVVSHDWGLTWSAPETVLDRGVPSAADLALVSDRGGNWALWSSVASGGIQYLLSRDDGDTWQSVHPVQELAAGAFDVAADGEGAWIGVWRDDRLVRAPDNLILAAHASCGNGIDESGEVCDDGNIAENDACDNSCFPTICGDFLVCDDESCDRSAGGPGLEECDTGAFDHGGTCTPECRLARCGDGFLCTSSDCVTGPTGGAERCDTGTARSDVTPNACRSDCSLPACGDGVVDDGFGEACDDGPGNVFAPDACRPDCALPTCGDGIPDPGAGEECDDGANNGEEPDRCRSDCANPECGDGIVDVLHGEECDSGDPNDPEDDGRGVGCAWDCKLQLCGNGVVDPGEECDVADTTTSPLPGGAEPWCNQNCRVSLCGNGVVDAGEDCDGGAGCTPWCVRDVQISDCRNRFLGLLGRELDRSLSAVGSCIQKVQAGRLDLPYEACADEPRTASKLERGQQSLDRKLFEACGPQSTGASFDAIAGVGACGTSLDTVSGGGCIDDAMGDVRADLVGTWFGALTPATSRDVRRCQKKLASGAKDLATTTFQALAACRESDVDSSQCLSGPGAQSMAGARAKLRKTLGARCSSEAVAELGLCAATLEGLIGDESGGGCLEQGHADALGRLMQAAVGR